MASDSTFDTLGAYPDLCQINDPVWQDFLASARISVIPAGKTIFHEGDSCSYYHLILDGTVKVQKVAENGREIVLYRVTQGQTCILTTSCALSSDHYPAEAITETEVQAISIPIDRFETILAKSPGFRKFVFSIYSHRIADLILLVEEVTFGRMDSRLAQCLLQKAKSATVVATHQVLAAELGTAREVISRLLKEFEKKNWVELNRGQIILHDPAALTKMAKRELM